MEKLVELFQQTKDIYDVLQRDTELTEEELINLETKLTNRETVMMQIEEPQTEVEKKIAAAILNMNQIIEQQLVRKQQEIMLNIERLKKKQEHVKTYVDPYASFNTHDGTFYDKKK